MQRWTIYPLLDPHADQGLVAITMGLSPHLGASQAMPVTTFSVIAPLPRHPIQLRKLLERVNSQYAHLMLSKPRPYQHPAALSQRPRREPALNPGNAAKTPRGPRFRRPKAGLCGVGLP